MTRHNSLSLPEEVMLLALHDEEGTIEMGSMYQYAIGGAVLAELLLRKRIVLDKSKKKSVHIANAKPLDEGLLNDCLGMIQGSKRKRTAQTWVSKFANSKNLKQRLAMQLCDRGILRAEQDKVLLLFTRKIYPEVDPKPEKELVDRLHQAIFTETGHLDPRTVVLVSLADSAGLLKNAFDKKDLKIRRDRIAHIAKGDATGEATKEAIEAVQAAIVIACILPTLTVATH